MNTNIKHSLLTSGSGNSSKNLKKPQIALDKIEKGEKDKTMSNMSLNNEDNEETKKIKIEYLKNEYKGALILLQNFIYSNPQKDQCCVKRLLFI